MNRLVPGLLLFAVVAGLTFPAPASDRIEVTVAPRRPARNVAGASGLK